MLGLLNVLVLSLERARIGAGLQGGGHVSGVVPQNVVHREM